MKSALIVIVLTRLCCVMCCDDLTEIDKSCGSTATVKDLTGLDGCGFVLELENGNRLVPQKLIYIQAPDPDQDPGYYFDFKDGEKVCFDYRDAEGVDACMAGQLVFLTCIKTCNGIDGNN